MTVRTTTRTAGTQIEARENFTTSGALHGEWHHMPMWLNVGILPGGWREKLRAIPGKVYVVYSYATPIAWFSDATGWTIPGVKYSPTTTKHQSNLSRVMAPGMHRGMDGKDWGQK